MTDIVLSTINARYAHTSLALRYLQANLGPLQSRTLLCEFVLQDRPVDIVERILAASPRIAAFGVYIWNATQTLGVVKLLKRLRPNLVVILGGPEISHEPEEQELAQLADYVIAGEGDVAFRTLCERLLAGRRQLTKFIAAPPPNIDQLCSPYPLYSAADIANRVAYVEASRGCPFRCEFCLSSLDQRVRMFPLSRLLADLELLIERGVTQFKFIDRTFNLKVEAAVSILEFFLSRPEQLFLHFEMIPDRFPDELRELIARFPPGGVQLEVGIQTFDAATARRIGRRQNYQRLEDNLRFLATQTGVHIHTDLIVGLPGETLEQFAVGFDRLVGLRPQEIQVGILKRLRGTPIVRHTEDYQMVYSPLPPYEILENQDLSFDTLTRLKRFARAWDLVANSGNFVRSTQLIWSDKSPFWSFLAFTDWLHNRVGAFVGIALPRLASLLFDFLTEHGIPSQQAGTSLALDYAKPGRRLPVFLREFDTRSPEVGASTVRRAVPARQARHLT